VDCAIAAFHAAPESSAAAMMAAPDFIEIMPVTFRFAWTLL
jgi:hypothetical protein